MVVKIGVNPLSWTNDDMPELGAETPLEVCLEEGRQAGYEGFELGNKFPRQLGPLRQVLAQHQLALVSGWHSGFLLQDSVDQAKASVADHLALLKGMGCKVLVFAECSRSVVGKRDMPLSKRPVLSAEQWPEFGRCLTMLADHMAEHGIRMAYHHHMGTVVQTQQEIDYLVEHTGESVGLLIDTGHLVFAGGDPVAVIERYGRRVVHVHCKDVRADVLQKAQADDSSFLDAVLAGVFTVPGDGCIDYRAVLSTLKQQRYSGWLVVEAEQDPAKAHPFTYVCRAYQYLSRVVDSVGL